MTNHSQTADVGELSQAVASLTEALVRTEKRSVHLTRIIHWILLGGLVLLVMAGFLIANRLDAAYASFDQFLFTVEKAIIQNEDMQQHVGEYIEKHGLDPALAEDKATIHHVVAERTIKILTDTFVIFEELGHNPGATLDNIGKQLQTMNKALAAMPSMAVDMKQMNQKISSVPAMAADMKQMSQKMSSVPAMAAHMDLMNRNIASMTTSMGSSMGRMGKWMPW